MIIFLTWHYKDRPISRWEYNESSRDAVWRQVRDSHWEKLRPPLWLDDLRKDGIAKELPISPGWRQPTCSSQWIYQALQCIFHHLEALAEPQYWQTRMHVFYCYSRQLVSSTEVAILAYRRGRQSSLECRSIVQRDRNTKRCQALTCTRLACYNCWMCQGDTTFWLRHFGVESILFTQFFVYVSVISIRCKPHGNKSSLGSFRYT